MNDDHTRYNLVTKFVCKLCGSPLRISYDKPIGNSWNPEASDGITGANKIEAAIAVYPCDKCYKEAVEPINQLRISHDHNREHNQSWIPRRE